MTSQYTTSTTESNSRKFKPVIFAVAGPSASGKDTLARLVSERLGYHPLVSWTTRPPRAGEENGIDYWFASKEEFKSAKNRGNFIEWSEFNGWFYGTPHDAVQESVNVGVFNLDGLAALAKHQDEYEVVPVFMEAPLLERLRRSVRRDGFSLEIVRRAFADAKDFDKERIVNIRRLFRNRPLYFDYRYTGLKYTDSILTIFDSYAHLLLDSQANFLGHF